jgi:hypothetical protein
MIDPNHITANYELEAGTWRKSKPRACDLPKEQPKSVCISSLYLLLTELRENASTDPIAAKV